MIDENDLILRVLNLGSFHSANRLIFRFESLTSDAYKHAREKFHFNTMEIESEALLF